MRIIFKFPKAPPEAPPFILDKERKEAKCNGQSQLHKMPFDCFEIIATFLDFPSLGRLRQASLSTARCLEDGSFFRTRAVRHLKKCRKAEHHQIFLRCLGNGLTASASGMTRAQRARRRRLGEFRREQQAIHAVARRLIESAGPPVDRPLVEIRPAARENKAVVEVAASARPQLPTIRSVQKIAMVVLAAFSLRALLR